MSHRSLFSRWHSTRAKSSQLHFGLSSSAHGFGAELVILPSFVDEVEGDGDGERHGDSDCGRSVVPIVVSEWAVEQRLPSIDGDELGGLAVTRSDSEPGDNGGDVDAMR